MSGAIAPGRTFGDALGCCAGGAPPGTGMVGEVLLREAGDELAPAEELARHLLREPRSGLALVSSGSASCCSASSLGGGGTPAMESPPGTLAGSPWWCVGMLVGPERLTGVPTGMVDGSAPWGAFRHA